MNFLDLIWLHLLEKPLYNALLLLYIATPLHNMGFALVSLTVFLRLLLLPLSFRGASANRRMAELQPQIDHIRKEFNFSIDEQRHRIRQLIRKNKINPYGGILSLILQAVLFVVLFTIFRHNMDPRTSGLTYSFFDIDPRNAILDTTFFGTFDLITPSLMVSFGSAVIVLLGLLLSWGRSDEEGAVDKWMFFVLPAITFFGTAYLPSSKAVFIATSVVFSMLLQILFWMSDSLHKSRAKKVKGQI